MNKPVRVSEAAFEYLKLQKGSLDKYSGDRDTWLSYYHRDLEDTFAQIEPHLPDVPHTLRLLDVGSGLGGIDALIRRKYEDQLGRHVHVNLLDGIADPPKMTLHRKTFNNMAIALDFQRDNGLQDQDFRCWGPDLTDFADNKFDLVVSFGSWCFHYSPSIYIRQVYRALAPGAVLILDVRRNKPDWFHTLEGALELVATVAVKDKFHRCVFKVPPL